MCSSDVRGTRALLEDLMVVFNEALDKRVNDLKLHPYVTKTKADTQDANPSAGYSGEYGRDVLEEPDYLAIERYEDGRELRRVLFLFVFPKDVLAESQYLGHIYPLELFWHQY
jgi:hypothetical protein